MEGAERSGGDAGEMDQMGTRGEQVYPRVYNRVRAQEDKFKLGAGKRTVKFERKLEEGRGGMLAMKCCKKMKKKIAEEKELSEWEEERRKFWEDRGKDMKEMAERGREEEVYDGWEQRDRNMQKEKRWERIGGARYNK